MAFPISPAVNVSEIDATGGIIGAGSTTGAFAGVFKWGPVMERVLLGSETDLKNRFGKPDIDTFISFFTCANFLQYGNALNVVRVVSDDALNATADASGLLIENDDIYSTQFAAGEAAVGRWAAKFAGDLGNSISVSIADAGNFGTWAYKASFTGAPTTSSYAAGVNGSNDEIHVVVLDQLGLWTGIVGGILEVYPYLSKAADARSDDGSSLYYPVAVNRGSKYVRWMDHDTNGTNWGMNAQNTAFKILTSTLHFNTFTGSFTNGETLFVGSSFGAATKKATLVSQTVVAGTAGSTTGSANGPFAVVTGTNDSLLITLDGGSPISVTLAAGGARTAAQVAGDINGTGGLSGVASAVGLNVKLTSTTTGASSQIIVGTPGSHPANTLLGFTAATYAGVAPHDTLLIQPVLGLITTSDLVKGNSSSAQGTPDTVTTPTVTDNLAGGVDGNDTIADGDKILGFDLFLDTENVDASLILAADASQAVALELINIAEQRKDAVAFISPEFEDVVANAGNEDTDVIAFRNSLTSSSYAFMDSNWKYMYDKYNDTFRWVPLNGDIAGLAVRTDLERDPWFSIAGLNRGVIKNVVKLAWNPNKADRDVLYSSGVNPVVTFPGTGAVLFGDKTMLSKPSAFDRINVRRLFIVLEKSIANSAKYVLFENNDPFTRNQFKSQVEPFLRGVQGGRGITDFLVVCDATNNTPDIIDSNQFVGDIYIKPERSINFIQLNFVAVRTGVAFNEIVGQF